MITDTGRYESLLGERVLDDPYVLCDAMRYAAVAKEKIVNEDPKEKGLRRILNFGHTAGHAYESYAARTGHPISHGEAVAHGMRKHSNPVVILSVSPRRKSMNTERRYLNGIMPRYLSARKPMESLVNSWLTTRRILVRDRYVSYCYVSFYDLFRIRSVCHHFPCPAGCADHINSRNDCDTICLSS